MATHPSIPAWRIPWTEEPGGIQSMRSHRDTTEATSHACRLLWDHSNLLSQSFSLVGERFRNWGFLFAFVGGVLFGECVNEVRILNLRCYSLCSTISSTISLSWTNSMLVCLLTFPWWPSFHNPVLKERWTETVISTLASYSAVPCECPEPARINTSWTLMVFTGVTTPSSSWWEDCSKLFLTRYTIFVSDFLFFL